MEEKEFVSMADFCNFNKKVERITIQPGAVMGREIEQPGVIKKLGPQARVPGGSDYAKPYIEEEERLLLQGYKIDEAEPLNLPGPSQRKFCEMEDVTSIGSVPNLGDVEDQDSLQVYDHYDFTPKENKLPIHSKRKEIIRMVDTNPVLIILGSTGCGKTTQVPQFILDDHAKQRKRCNIIVTQPRRIAATSVATRVCAERGWELSTIVGYQIGLDNKTSSDTRLTYCTTGVLREKLVKTKNMLEYTHVIIDEVHERDLETDFLLLIIKQLARTNSTKVKIILMSATIDPSHFARYFPLPIGNILSPAPILEVEKDTNYTITHFYIEQLSKLALGNLPLFEMENPQVHDEVLEIAVRLIQHLDKIDSIESKAKNKKPSALVFLPGIHEIETMHDRLSRFCQDDEEKYPWHLIPLHSSITKAEQSKVFRDPRPGYRKVILSTNIAESSITVADVGYVIDFCLTKHLICDEVTNFTTLRYAWASHSNCKQRAGRAGRVSNGRVYRLVPHKFYEEQLPVETDPEMIRCPLSQVVLKAKLLKMGEPKAILARALDPPDITRLETTILILKEAGALLTTVGNKVEKYDGDITFLGTVMSHLPLDIQLSKLIMLGNVFSILEDTIAIAAWMSVRNIFKNDFYDRLGPYGSRISFTGATNSDCIAYLHVYRTYKEKLRVNYFKTSKDTETSWCKRNFLDLKALKEADELVDEIRKRLKNMGVFESSSDARPQWDDFMLPFVRKLVIAGAFYPNYFVRSSLGGRVDEKDAVRALNGKDPCSTVYLSGFPSAQPGQLYSKAFAKILGIVGPVSNVSFDGSSKVYVEFERHHNPDLSGKISEPVYRAIKMRQLRMPIEIPILRVEDADKRMKKYGEVADRYLCIGKLKAQPRDRLPGISVEVIKFVPSHVDDPNKFWIHSEVEAELESVQNRLNTPGNIFSLTEKPVVGGIYAAPYPLSSEYLYRAQITVIYKESQSASVKFIDYGNVERNMPIKSLYDLGPTLQDLKNTHIVPPFALECTLTGIGPSPLTNVNEIWSRASINTFKKMIACGELLGKIYSVVNGVLSLTITQCGEQKSVNKIMIEQGFAVQVEENFRSKSNNVQRLASRNYCSDDSHDSQQQSGRVLIFDDSSNTMKSVGDFMDPPTRQECRDTVRMRGPHSPLEMKVFGCTYVSSGKEVTMDVESVNSVLLDSNPEDPHERLLVAGFVRTNSAGTKLKLGHTTLMPNIKGFSSLMCLIFAPKVELRLSKDKCRYIGALCGLGFDKVTGEPFFPENEMEMIFDCLIDVYDMTDINKLRYWMSRPLVSAENDDEAPEATPRDVLTAQQKVYETFIKLLHRDRPSQEPEHFIRSREWNQFDDADLLRPDNCDDGRHVFQQHSALAVKNFGINN